MRIEDGSGTTSTTSTTTYKPPSTATTTTSSQYTQALAERARTSTKTPSPQIANPFLGYGAGLGMAPNWLWPNVPYLSPGMSPINWAALGMQSPLAIPKPPPVVDPAATPTTDPAATPTSTTTPSTATNGVLSLDLPDWIKNFLTPVTPKTPTVDNWDVLREKMGLPKADPMTALTGNRRQGAKTVKQTHHPDYFHPVLPGETAPATTTDDPGYGGYYSPFGSYYGGGGGGGGNFDPYWNWNLINWNMR